MFKFLLFFTLFVNSIFAITALEVLNAVKSNEDEINSYSATIKTTTTMQVGSVLLKVDQSMR